MYKTVQPALEALFAEGGTCRRPVSFSWRLVRRKRRPFLLLPEKTSGASDSFALYSAQRPLAKLWRLLIPFVLKSWLARFFGRIAIKADPQSEFMRFLAQQSGVPAGELTAPAIKFGGVEGKTARLVLLLCDAGGNPIRVIKVGVDSTGGAATAREAELLSQLPEEVIGCTGISGRFTSGRLNAFGTDYFSGKSLANDVGVEKLFHDWLNDGPPEFLENLPIWRNLESAAINAGLPQWPALQAVFTGRKVRTTIYHGDFTPWNVRMTNLENIRAFDWERGELKGLPAWDWFHFIVQISILVKRNSPERVAAELEQLIHSTRFQKYAREAGISKIIEPLLLAYLLEQKLVVRPLEGHAATDQLFRLLWTKWRLSEAAGQTEPTPAAERRKPAREQIKHTWAMLSNLFWEPRLSPLIKPSLRGELFRHWLALPASFVWIGGVAALQFNADPHLSFVAFYLVPGMLMTLQADRRFGFLLAGAAAIAGPLTQHLQRATMIPMDVICWNILMRGLVFFLVVMLLDTVHKQTSRDRSGQALPEPSARQAVSDNWAVLLFTGIYFSLIIILDAVTNPHRIFLPLYLLPCVIFTLTLNRRWGTLAAVIASIAGPLTQRYDDPAYQIWGIELWNTFMRLVIFQTVVLLLDCVRRENILFRGIETVKLPGLEAGNRVK